ncbi:TPA: PrgH/EprH family type III secretion apparatus protein [Salmonella enterica]|nr:PrgH/EprH family type III secretion apparatus protein [Salmonella enterica]
MSDPQSYVIRILNGPLQGCEYTLQSGKLLFIVGKNLTMLDDSVFPVLPDNTIYVPLQQESVNFEITADENERIQLHELTESGGTTRFISFNTPVRVGELVIAVRAHNQAWHSSVLLSPEHTGARKKFKLNRIAVLFMFIILGGGLLGGGLIWSSSQRQVIALNGLLGVEKHRFQILPGRDHQYYIFARNEQERLWARQVAVREGYGEASLVIDAEVENKRITRWLDINYPGLAYYRLHMDEPDMPRLWISRQRTNLNDSGREALTKSLMMLLPYARSVEIVPVSDETALSQAEEGLKHRNIPFYRKKKEGVLTFTISGELSDSEIFRARKFINEYNQKWGKQYIQFAIELKDDWSRERSFKYGNYMYVKTAPDVWSFINNN